MSLGLLLGQEQTRRLYYVLGLDLVPLQVRGILLGGYADSGSVNDELAVLDVEINGAVELAVHRVVLQHVGHVCI